MKKNSEWMKILIFLPVLLFALLIGWIAVNELKTKEGGEEITKETSSVTEIESSILQAVSESQEETSPLVLDTEGVSQESKEETEDTSPVNLLFAGDILLSNHVTTAYDNAGGINGVLDEGYQAEISQSDIFMANEEFPFSDRGSAAEDKQYTFRLTPSRVTMMQEIGVDIVTLANNHTLDYGTDALVDTAATLDGAGIKYVGAGANMERARQLQTIEVRGNIIGFLAASRVYPDPDWVANSKKPGMVSGYDPSILLEEIKAAQDLCDYLVVYVHWGIERNETPEEYQRSLGKKIIDAGADIVIGSHPHVLQGVEYYNGKPICYSLGNFIFGSSIPKTALLQVQVDVSQQNATLSLIPGTSKSGYTRELTDTKEIQDFYQYYQGISFGISVDENGVINNSES